MEGVKLPADNFDVIIYVIYCCSRIKSLILHS